MNLSPKRKISVQSKKLVTVTTLVIILITLSLFFYFKVRQSEVPRTTITTNKPGQNVTLTNTPTIYNPNKLVVTRQDDPVDHLSALTITITDAILVKKLYDDILVLPTLFPAEKCPMGGHIIYSLTFYQDNKLI